VVDVVVHVGIRHPVREAQSRGDERVGHGAIVRFRLTP
jgi:hypothetical protein